MEEGGTPEDNARIVESVLRGEPGARRDVVLLNAAAALVVAGIVDDLPAGVDRAALTIDRNSQCSNFLTLPSVSCRRTCSSRA